MNRISRTVRWLLRATAHACLFASLVSPGVASAHPIVEAGVEAASDARFEDALAAFDRAWRAEDLTRQDIIDLLVHRALVHAAVRANAEFDDDLRMLVHLDPTFQLPLIAPPQVRRRFEAIRAEPRTPASVSVSVDFGPSGTTFDVDVIGLPTGLVRRVRVFGRPGRGAWSSGDGTHVELPIVGAEAVDWYVEVHGPGGATLLGEGSASSPRRAINPVAYSVATSTDSDATSTDSGTPNDDRRSRRGMWWGIGGGAAAVVLTTVLVVVIRDPAPNTRVEGPVFR